MLEVLTSLAPEALILLIGFTFVKLKWFPDAALQGLSKFAYGIAIPLMLFHTLALIDLPDQPPWSLWATYLGGTVTLMVGVHIFSRWAMGFSAPAASTMAIAGGFSNLVVLGIPFNLSVIGDKATFAVYAIISIHAFCLISVATLMAEIKVGRSWLNSLFATAKDTLRNPVIIGILSGIAWSYLGLPYPQLLDDTVGKIAATATPVALFALGGTLAGLKLKGSMPKLSLMLCAKLVLHPLWISFLALVVFDLPPAMAAVCILSACLPTGINGFLFASHYKESERSVAGVILIATPLGLVLYAAVASFLL